MSHATATATATPTAAGLQALERITAATLTPAQHAAALHLLAASLVGHTVTADELATVARVSVRQARRMPATLANRLGFDIRTMSAEMSAEMSAPYPCIEQENRGCDVRANVRANVPHGGPTRTSAPADDYWKSIEEENRNRIPSSIAISGEPREAGITGKTSIPDYLRQPLDALGYEHERNATELAKWRDIYGDDVIAQQARYAKEQDKRPGWFVRSLQNHEANPAELAAQQQGSSSSTLQANHTAAGASARIGLLEQDGRRSRAGADIARQPEQPAAPEYDGTTTTPDEARQHASRWLEASSGGPQQRMRGVTHAAAWAAAAARGDGADDGTLGKVRAALESLDTFAASGMWEPPARWEQFRAATLQHLESVPGDVRRRGVTPAPRRVPMSLDEIPELPV